MNSAGYPDLVVMGAGGPNCPFQVPINSGTPDVYGSYWYMREISGWDAPDVRATMTPLLGQEGELPLDNHYRGRSIVISGWAECPSEAVREQSKLLLAAATNAVWGQPPVVTTPQPLLVPNENLGMLYVGEAPSKVVFFVRAGNRNRGMLKCVDNGIGVKTAPQSGTAGNLPGLPQGEVWLIDYEFEIYCPDPFKYSGSLSGLTYQSLSFSGGGTVTSAGTAPTPVIAAVVTNTDYAAVLWNTTISQLMVLTVPSVSPPLPPMPGTVLIDTGQRIISDGSVSRYDLLSTTTDWWMLQPGDNNLSAYGGLNGELGPLLTVVWWADRWI